MNRFQFLKSLGISGAAVMAVSCLGGCSENNEPMLNTMSVDFTLNLNDSVNGSLSVNGGFIVRDGVIVARTNTGNFVALSSLCTHEYTELLFEPANNRFVCPNHGSTFNVNGAVTNGPARFNLNQYITTFNSSNNTLRINS